ncbi:MAG TPA: response regulator [Candidatus Dormibacteraeota bacterium]|nr:response regulator [Candidatus Dormibacteraeota bacterium]
MAKLLVVDDDEAIRKLHRLNLADTFDIIDTAEPEHALALALEHKPDAILLDLMMPKYSGLELCQTLTSFSSTQLIPVLVVSGEIKQEIKTLCHNLGASAFFEKPVDYDALKASLASILQAKRPERRSEVRVRLRTVLKLRGLDNAGKAFEELTTTENLGQRSFLCGCTPSLKLNSVVDVLLISGIEEPAGKARVVRCARSGTQYPRYGFQFVEKTGHWVLG